jgi:hypothetical protein
MQGRAYVARSKAGKRCLEIQCRRRPNADWRIATTGHPRRVRMTGYHARIGHARLLAGRGPRASRDPDFAMAGGGRARRPF